ncbi:hypothetical protein GCM10009557_90760 [Virgisporangium ochraceum]
MDLLAHLAAFVAVADEASFSRAADRLGIAQPLLSRRVRTLEEHFGGPLFDRSPRRVSTTDFGQLLLPSRCSGESSPNRDTTRGWSWLFQ